MPASHVATQPTTQAHPRDKQLILSAGYDGRAFLWDIYAGVPLLKLMNSPGTLILEGQFSCGGDHVVLCDHQGFLSVFGSGSPPKCLKEQFFVDDYAQLTYDHAGQVIDAMRQTLPHLLPRELCDSDNTRYPNLLQPRWPCQRIPRESPPA